MESPDELRACYGRLLAKEPRWAAYAAYDPDAAWALFLRLENLGVDMVEKMLVAGPGNLKRALSDELPPNVRLM